MDRNRKMLKMIEKNNSWRLILAMIRIAIYGITGIAVNLYIGPTGRQCSQWEACPLKSQENQLVFRYSISRRS